MPQRVLHRPADPCRSARVRGRPVDAQSDVEDEAEEPEEDEPDDDFEDPFEPDESDDPDELDEPVEESEPPDGFESAVLTAGVEDDPASEDDDVDRLSLR